jgi:hypothetical protein
LCNDMPSLCEVSHLVARLSVYTVNVRWHSSVSAEIPLAPRIRTATAHMVFDLGAHSLNQPLPSLLTCLVKRQFLLLLAPVSNMIRAFVILNTYPRSFRQQSRRQALHHPNTSPIATHPYFLQRPFSFFSTRLLRELCSRPPKASYF